ncbi:MAG: mobilization protein [Frankiales bacterium]|nr:mobilization protein [Frankiales bacterium]
MIGRVYRGAKVAGLLRYLYGPGRHNEHEDPHLVAAWDLQTPAELATLEPEGLTGVGASALRDLGALTASMELATALRRLPESVAARQVWHCPLRVAPGDRVLTDAEWGEVARDVMHRTGIAERGDDGGCRWIAVRHDAHSVHLVAVLARQDGRAARVSYDHLRVREACRAPETRLGLTGAAPADRTAATHVTRAEVEKARRTGGPRATPDRVWLRDQVQFAAIAAPSAPAFLHRLTTLGVLVRERRDADGALAGYAVARPSGFELGDPVPVFYGGGKLAPDLTLPKLQARWQQESDASPPPLAPQALTVLSRVDGPVARAARHIRDAAATGDPAAVREAGALAQVTAQVLTAAARLVDGDTGGDLTRTARLYDRVSREPSQRPAPVTSHSRALRDVAVTLMRAGRAGRSSAPVLLGQLLQLVDAVRLLREAQGRLAQARAAQQAVLGVQAVERQQRRATAASAAVSSASAPAPVQPRPAARLPQPPTRSGRGL